MTQPATHAPLPQAVLDDLRQFSTCVVSSTIETFGVRLPNVGFADSRVRSVFPELPAVVGYAVTARVRSATPPMEGGTYYARTELWEQIVATPLPRIVVIQDTDNPPGLGAFVGEVHANILKALGCAGLVTNGAVRDVREVHAIQFPMFAGNVSVSHAYAHVSDFGQVAEVGGLKVHPGDLLMADVHGVLSIPLEIAARIPREAKRVLERRKCLVDLCRSEDCRLESLKQACEGLGVMKQEADEMPNSGPKRGQS